MTAKKIFIIAGEASGDTLGAKLISEIKEQFLLKNQSVEFCGVGGAKMQELGFKSIFSIDDLSVMGFAEIIPHIFKLLKRITETANAIISYNPDFVITIDSPDFNFRVMKRLKNFSSAKKIHLIAPSVWAYREGRAKKISKLYDLLLAILPFEPPYFTKHGLKTIFIGHPIVEDFIDFNNKNSANENFRIKYGFYKNDTILYVTAGSRTSEVKKIFPEFIKAINLLKNEIENLSIIIPTVSKTKKIVEDFAKNLNVKYVIISQNEKQNALFASNFALAKSGTNTLEASIYKLPMVVAYKVNFITFVIAKILVKIKFANLINLIMNREIIPELLQEKCKGEIIKNKLKTLILNKDLSDLQIKESEIALRLLGQGSNAPTKKAVEEILKC